MMVEIAATQRQLEFNERLKHTILAKSRELRKLKQK